jgi:hypothetical protein
MKFEIAPKSTEIQANWETAKAYCDVMNTAGQPVWRLPNKEELDLIFHSNNDFENTWYYWSTDNDLPANQNFHNGYQFSDSKNCEFWVRAIRDLKDN